MAENTGQRKIMSRRISATYFHKMLRQDLHSLKIIVASKPNVKYNHKFIKILKYLVLYCIVMNYGNVK